MRGDSEVSKADMENRHGQKTSESHLNRKETEKWDRLLIGTVVKEDLASRGDVTDGIYDS